jgi:hypothetical protein
MAKQTVGYLGGFQGTLGPAIGYMWNGKWCVRSKPGVVANPRTPEQVAQRELFKREVRLAADLGDTLVRTMREPSREMGMTSYNLFVHVNQQAFSMLPYSSTTAERRSPSPSLGEEPSLLQSRQVLSSSSPETGEGDPSTARGEEYDLKTSTMGTFEVDWRSLRLSLGDVPSVEAPTMTLTEGNVLEINFEKGRGYSHDQVFAVVYAPGLHYSFMSHPAFRRDRHISIALPDRMAREELQVWLLAESPDGRWSEAVYVESEELGVSSEELGTYSSPLPYLSSTADTEASHQQQKESTARARTSPGGGV